MFQVIKQLFKYFLLGVLAVIPVLITIQIVLFTKELLTDLIVSLYGYSASYSFTTSLLVLSIALLTYIGYSITRYRRSIIISAIDAVIEKIPLLNTVYRVSKKVIAMFTTAEEAAKREVVYVEYPKEEVWVPAYVTNKIDDTYILFVPTSPNPTSGFTVIVHESKVVHSDLSIEEAASFIISIGADYPRPEEVKRLKLHS
ncbi:hypothetical protein MIT9_P1110 [Methylomarinovum caldicuralii]|uniref:DUF502 domain-containing protein n=1 Tax=Methylomarinovum caldicuralii TaxID=438856 RepID=A0AAU9CUD7_9GAMM|nr:DUF502 domain-containing protein [Methylomarinovum caldicuralii]BCX81532.1 hypothetical protein MIT9_P1110 [Methylomarinovum caldicuralii]